jgi:hypothetical protein
MAKAKAQPKAETEVEVEAQSQPNVLFEAVSSFLAADGWNATQVEGDTSLQLLFQGSQSQWLCFVQVREDVQQVIFYSICPVIVPAEKRMDIAEYITRANYGLILGNFEMDFDDGELRYKTSLDVEGITFTAELLRPLIIANITTMDHYLQGALSVIFGDKSPEQAILQIEL